MAASPYDSAVSGKLNTNCQTDFSLFFIFLFLRLICHLFPVRQHEATRPTAYLYTVNSEIFARILFSRIALKDIFRDGKGIMATVPAWCVSAHASFVFKIDSQKTQYLLIPLNKMQLLKKIILYGEVIF